MTSPVTSPITTRSIDLATPKLSDPPSERDHVRGSLDAPVTIVEYGDYECPDCGRAFWVVKELLEESPENIAFVFRNFPRVAVHPRAESVAEALEAAAAQGLFWATHDWFYEHQHQLEIMDLERHISAIGGHVDAWNKDWRERTYRHRVQEDVASATRSGVRSTPTFFINGIRFEGTPDLASLRAAVQAAKDEAA